MGPGTVHARPGIFVLLCLVPIGLAVLRYVFALGQAPKWQALQVAVGYAIAFAILFGAHGRSFFASIRPRSWLLLATGVGCFLLLWYFGRKDAYIAQFGRPPTTADTFTRLGPFFFLVVSTVGARLLLPLAIARALKLHPRELGFRLAPSEGLRRIGWVYVALFALVVPFVIAASAQASFLRSYPYAREIVDAHRTIELGPFLVYQLCYLFVFVSGESLWRGYLTFGLEADFGLYAIALMLVPYVTSHFGKPFPEVVGAVLAGSTLAFLALKHRSFYFGIALHYAIALLMDVCAILRLGVKLHT